MLLFIYYLSHEAYYVTVKRLVWLAPVILNYVYLCVHLNLKGLHRALSRSGHIQCTLIVPCDLI